MSSGFFIPAVGERAEELKRRAARRRIVGWVFPNVALCLSLATLFWVLIPFDAPRSFFLDAATGRHIATGQLILSRHSLPASDPYSFARAGQPWMALSWLSDLIMGFTAAHFGLQGIVWLFSIALAAVTWLWVRLNWAVSGNFVLVVLLAIPMLAVSSREWVASPHVFGWILLLSFLCFLENQRFAFSYRHGAMSLFISAIWANADPAFLLAPILAGVYALSHVVRPALWNLDRNLELRRARWYLYACLYSLIGTLLNPYGIRAHVHVLASLSGVDDVHFPHSIPAFFVLAVSAVGATLALKEGKLAHFCIALGVFSFEFGHASLFAISALVLLPFANAAITDSVRNAHDWRPAVRDVIRYFLAYSDHLRLIDARLSGLWIAPVAAMLAAGWLMLPEVARHTGFPSDRFPVFAAPEVARLPETARLLAPADYGDYIVYRFRGARKVFLDGRWDWADAQLRSDYSALMDMRPGWEDALARYRFTHALLPRNSLLAQVLEQRGWSLIFQDDTAALLAVRSPATSLVR